MVFFLLTWAEDTEHSVAKDTLINASNDDGSWYGQIRSLCFQYNLPNPLTLLHQPPSQKRYKCLIKNNVAQFWQEKLRVMKHRGEPNKLTSLKYFKPEYICLCSDLTLSLPPLLTPMK